MAKENRKYLYDPSVLAAGIFIACFGITTAWHMWQLYRKRTWYFIPFVAGGLLETLGYLVRLININQKPDYVRGPYIIQTIFILLSPALYAASIYMILGRLMVLLDAEQYSLIKRKWLTLFFVAGDIVSFLTQGAGGGILASSNTKSQESMGKNIIVTGLFVQVVFFGLFITVTALFHRRVSLRPTARSGTVTVDWRRYLLVLYGVSILVMVRSIFRCIEYIQGREGELQTHEAYFYIFDALLMFSMSVVFNFFHPYTIIAPEEKGMALLERNLPSSQV